jgi:prepilin-type N-terminal cleavage/methylation domain-containing protein
MLRRRRRQGKGEAGFTLLEVVVAMGILATGLLAVAAAQLTAIRMSARSKNLMHATHLAQAQMEAFQALPQASLPATGNDPNNPIALNLTSDPNNPDATTFNRSWVITPNDPSPGITKVTVQVDWFDDKVSTTRSTTLQTLKGF